jgi:hypothetical protein
MAPLAAISLFSHSEPAPRPNAALAFNPMTLADLIAKSVADPTARQQLTDAIVRAGGKLDFSLATVIPAGTDLSKFTYIAGAPGAPTQYVTVKDASYTCTPTFALNIPNVSIVGSNNPLTFLNVPGAGTGIELRGNGITFAGFNVVNAVGTMTVVRVFGTDCNVDVTTSVPVGICIKVEPSADRQQLRYVATVPTGGQGAYVVGAEDVTFHDCQSAGSLGEDDIRFSRDNPAIDGTPGKVPRRGRVLRSTLLACHQVGSKQSASVSFRDMGDGSPGDWCEVSDCTLGEWARMGQDAPKPTVWGLKFNRNHFLPEPHGITQLDLIAATMDEFDGNTFDCPPSQRAIGGTVGVSKICPLTNNTIRTVPHGAGRKKLFIWNNGSGETDGVGLKVI